MRTKIFINKIDKQYGLTLTELIVAMAIFSIMCVSLLLSFTNGLQVTIRAGNREKALLESANMINEYRTHDSRAELEPEITPDKSIRYNYRIHYPSLSSQPWPPPGGAPDVYYFDSEVETKDGQKVVLRGFNE